MVMKSRIAASRKSKAKAGKRKAAAKTTARKANGLKAAKRTAVALAKAAGKRTKAATQSGRTIVRKAMKALAGIASPIIPSRESK
jgi:hypothetical protein